MNAPVLSTLFKSILADVDTASGGMGAAVSAMLEIGHCEYLTFADFRTAVKAGLSAHAWATVTNYMGPMNRAWDNHAVQQYCDTVREFGIKAANKLFPAGTGKRGAPVELKPVGEQPTIEVVLPTSPEAIATAKADAEMAALAATMQAESDAAELVALRVEVTALHIEVAALRAENATLKALNTAKGKQQAVAA